MKRYDLLTLVAAGLVACGGGQEKPDDRVKEESLSERPADAPPDLSNSKCHGNRVPPTNYLQETAFVPAGNPNATEEAKRAAVQQLRDRICQGYRCGALEPKISHWHTASDAVQVCAMAVIKASDVAAFKEAPRKKFDEDLRARAKQLVSAFPSSDGARIAFDFVRDVGVDGGPRAEWLIDRMSAALSNNGALIARVPPDWSGLTLPPGVDGVLRGRITPMHGRETMLEVTWSLEIADGVSRAFDPIAFPELIGPAINPLTHLPDLAGVNPAISLRFDARPGGALCHGQTTELRLETAEALHVRVVNLFGDGSRGMVIHAPDEKTTPREATALGRFQVVKDGNVPVERFLVLGSETEAGLGELADVRAPCRLDPTLAKRLSSGRGVPSGAKDYTTSRSYRIIEGEECSSFTAPDVDPKWFDQLPICR